MGPGVRAWGPSGGTPPRSSTQGLRRPDFNKRPVEKRSGLRQPFRHHPGYIAWTPVPELPEVETIARGLANAVSWENDRLGDGASPQSGPSRTDSVRAGTRRGADRYGGGQAREIRGFFAWLGPAARGSSPDDRAAHRPAGGDHDPGTVHERAARPSGTARVCALRTSASSAGCALWSLKNRGLPRSDSSRFRTIFLSRASQGLLDGRTTPIKVFLLDQRRIAGIGNIYACEALWAARIRPNRPAGTLSKPARRRLHASIIDVLRRAIEMRGTSVDDYVDADGLRGGFQNALSVYGREGESCPRCQRPIVRTVVAQRGTWWCRTCQRR
jgi:hypothetical protein